MALYIPDVNDIKEAVKLALIEHENAKREKVKNEKLYTVNQVAKRFRKAHATIKKLVISGQIKTTSNGLITEDAINEYLRNY